MNDSRHPGRETGYPMHVPAAWTDGAGDLQIGPIEVGPPGLGEVAVELRAAGLCRTDLDSLHWGRPMVLGHEGAGVVRATGPGVDLAIGHPVILNWAMPCGRCVQCSLGHQPLCERRDDVDRLPAQPRLDGSSIERSFNLGTMSSITVVPIEAIVPISPIMPFASAALVGCAVMTGYGSVVHAARVAAGSIVAVLGVGGVGLNVVQTARLAGALRVIAIARSDRRLEEARRFGATDLVRVTDGAGVDQVRELTGGRGADYAFECTGDPNMAVAPLALVRHGGTAVQVSGIESTIPVDMTLFEWDKTYVTPLYGGCRPQIDIPTIVDLYFAGRLEIDALISAMYPLDTVADAFADLAAGRVTKAVIEFPAV